MGNWLGWHHHPTLALLATWFLVVGPGGRKKTTPALTVPQVRAGLALILHRANSGDAPNRVARELTRWLERNESARFYHDKVTQSTGVIEDRPHVWIALHIYL